MVQKLPLLLGADSLAGDAAFQESVAGRAGKVEVSCFCSWVQEPRTHLHYFYLLWKCFKKKEGFEWPNNSIPDYMPNKTWHMLSKRHGYGSTILNSQRLKPTQMSIMRTMGYKLWLCLHCGKLRSCKSEWSTAVGENVDELHQRNELKKPDREGYKLHDFVDTKDKTSKANLGGKEAGEWSSRGWSEWREHEGF